MRTISEIEQDICVAKRKVDKAHSSSELTAAWKTQARMTPAAKVDLTPENNLFLTPEEFGRYNRPQ